MTKKKRGRPSKVFFDYKTPQEEIDFCQNCPHKDCKTGDCKEFSDFKKGEEKCCTQ